MSHPRASLQNRLPCGVCLNGSNVHVSQAVSPPNSAHFVFFQQINLNFSIYRRTAVYVLPVSILAGKTFIALLHLGLCAKDARHLPCSVTAVCQWLHRRKGIALKTICFPSFASLYSSLHCLVNRFVFLCSRLECPLVHFFRWRTLSLLPGLIDSLTGHFDGWLFKETISHVHTHRQRELAGNWHAPKRPCQQGPIFN